MRRFFAPCFMLSLVFSGFAQNTLAQQLADFDKESEDIYASIIDWRVARPGEGPTASEIVILDKTVPMSCIGAKRGDCTGETRKNLNSIFRKDALSREVHFPRR